MPPQRKTHEATVRVSVSCLAELMNSPNRSFESLLRPYKFNKRGKGFARSGYYQRAIAAIRNYHSNGNDPKIFQTALLELRRKPATGDENWRRVKYEKNAAAIEAYSATYGKRHFRVLTNHRIGYPIGQVVFTAQPDLWVEEEGTQVLVKIGIAKKQSSYVDMLLTVMRKAAVSSGHRNIRARNVVYLNVTTGKEMICESSLTRFNRTFAFIARNIAKAWPNVTPPPEQGKPSSHAASA
jgi:hypothetical protein